MSRARVKSYEMCPHCRRPVAVGLDGKLHTHGPRERRCQGSRQYGMGQP